jgi:polar amino acid transport system substrate-binding protein
MTTSPHHRIRAAIAAAALLVVAGCGSGGTSGSTSAALDPQVIKSGTLTVCTSFGFPPFEFKKDGKAQGFDIDLATEIARRLNVKPVFVNGDFDDIQSGQLLNDGKCDVAAAAITINGDRARVLDFSSPYFDAGQAMVVKATSDATSLEDLAKKRVGVQSATTSEVYVSDNAPKTTTVKAYKNPTEITAALKSGAIDAGFYDNTVVGDVISRNPKLSVAAEFDTGEQYGMAVKKDGSVDLLRFINNVLANLKSGDGYDTIYRRWFGDASVQ